jgi:hypothetical protein
MVKVIKIDDVEYIRKDEITIPEGDLKIVILQRGWIMIGRFERKGNDCKLFNSSTIRSWGTTKGLGQLAKEGPQTNTKLDKNYGVVEFDYLTVCAMISCEEKPWENAL